MIPLSTTYYYESLTPVEKQEICNGTGVSGSPKWVVCILDSFGGFGINYRPASNIHDSGYYFSICPFEKIKEDFRFLLNMIIISINACLTLPIANTVGNVIFLPFRAVRASLYFTAVFVFGWFAWYSNIGHKK